MLGSQQPKKSAKNIRNIPEENELQKIANMLEHKK